MKSTELRGRKTETQVVLSEQWEQNKPWFKVHCITVSQGYRLIHVLFFWASSIKLGQIKRAMQLALRSRSTYICVNASVFIQIHFVCILCNALRVVTVRPLKNFTYGNYFLAKQNFWSRESER